MTESRKLRQISQPGRRICWATVMTSLGQVLIAASEKGVCRVAFGEDGAGLAKHFPCADLQRVRADDLSEFAKLVVQVVAVLETPAMAHDIPIDVHGTPFQQECWNALRAIPVGETRSYAELAAAVGRPKAARAVGLANGANGVAVLIPCHRVIRANGSLGGYAYGEVIKRQLLEREKQALGAR